MIAVRFALLPLVLWPGLALAQPSLSAGHILAAQRCGACHAVDKDDMSPNPRAPRFRDLGARYPLGGLQEALTQGMIIGHPQMPAPVLSRIQIEDLIAYLRDLQTPTRSGRTPARIEPGRIG